MKRFKLAAVAAASLVAVGFAHAGVLQVTPVPYAAESFSASATASVQSPLFSYTLAAPVNTGSNPTFTFEFTLTDAQWDYGLAQGGTQPLGTTASVLQVSITDPISGQTTNAAIIGRVGTDNAKFKATFNATSWAGTPGYVYPSNSYITVGTAAVQPLVKPTVATTEPANLCLPNDKNVSLAVKMTNAANVETNETNGVLSPLAAQKDTYLISKSALQTTLAVRPNNPLSLLTKTEKSLVDVINVLSPSRQPGTFFTVDPVAATRDSTDAAVGALATDVIEIGRLVIADRGSFTDASPLVANSATTDVYSVAGASFGSITDIDSSPTDGGANLTSVKVTVNGTYAAGSSLGLSFDNCATRFGTSVLNTGLTQAVLTTTAGSLAGMPNFATAAGVTNHDAVAADDVIGTGKRYASLCYSVPPTNTANIPASVFSLVGGSDLPALANLASSRITHTAGEAGGPVCGAPLYVLQQNGVKIDVRNFVGKATGAYAAGWRSFVRVINTDENQTATVRAQVIKNDGVLLDIATLIPSLPPRGYKFLSSDDIETAFGTTSSAGYADAAGANVRIRVSANNSSIRLQNYLFNPATNNFIEASGSQGDEGSLNLPFTGTATNATGVSTFGNK
jgi:hypothetical protein